MRRCDNKKNISEYLLMETFKLAKENILTFNPDHGSELAWIFRILNCVLKDNGYIPVLNFKSGEKLNSLDPETKISVF